MASYFDSDTCNPLLLPLVPYFVLYILTHWSPLQNVQNPLTPVSPCYDPKGIHKQQNSHSFFYITTQKFFGHELRSQLHAIVRVGLHDLQSHSALIGYAVQLLYLSVTHMEVTKRIEAPDRNTALYNRTPVPWNIIAKQFKTVTAIGMDLWMPGYTCSIITTMSLYRWLGKKSKNTNVFEMFYQLVLTLKFEGKKCIFVFFCFQPLLLHSNR